MKKARKHPVIRALLYIAAAVALAAAPWAVSRVQAADQRSSSGASRPIMPGNQPAGTGLQQQTPGSTMGHHPNRPATSGPNRPGAAPSQSGEGPPPTSISPSGSSSPLKGQGTVQGSKGAPGSSGEPAGGTAGSRGAKDGSRGH
jgi:hypothetical protein